MVKMKGQITQNATCGKYFAALLNDGSLTEPKWIPDSCCHVIKHAEQPMDTIVIDFETFEETFSGQDIDTEE